MVPAAMPDNCFFPLDLQNWKKPYQPDSPLAEKNLGRLVVQTRSKGGNLGRGWAGRSICEVSAFRECVERTPQPILFPSRSYSRFDSIPDGLLSSRLM